jgi:hypothetical protein
MPRRKPVADPPPAAPSVVRPLLRRWLLQILVLLVVVGLTFGGLLWLGAFAREQIRGRERYQVVLIEIECVPPPGLKREEFLEEVAYHARLPERFSILEEGLTDKLTAAFAKHPWVAKVERVELTPPRRVGVVLTYRRPVLAVLPPDHAVRAVDEQGVVLPKTAATADLLMLCRSPAPTGPAGQPWGDPTVAAAARAAILLQPRMQRLLLTALTWTPDGLVLWALDAKILWGRDGEPAAAVKAQRLLDALQTCEPLSSWGPWMHEFDLRPSGGIGHRLIVKESP